MDVEVIRNYCLSLNGAEECFPFGEDVLVFKVLEKMFALISLKDYPIVINLKCKPELSEVYREKYAFVRPGYHMNKKHWNSIDVTQEVSEVFLMELIQHSYSLVVQSCSKVKQMSLKD